MRDYLTIGTAPAEEDCAQVGQPGYLEQARAECKRFINVIRKTLGPERGTARLAIKPFPHDFGTYLEVVCYYDEHDREGMDYAYLVEEKAPTRWDQQDTITVSCNLCHNETDAQQARLHQSNWVCPDCWDERLQATA